MMKTNGTNDRNLYLEEWTQMMVNIWEEKILLLDIHDTGALYDSLKHHLIKESGGDITRIDHFFNFYGIYVDKGTGKEFARGNGGDIGFTPNRKPKPWFNSKFYYYTMKLAEKMAELSGKDFTYIMKNVIEGTK